MRAINILTHCLTCKGLCEDDLKRYNICESHKEKNNVRSQEEEDLQKFVFNSNYNSYAL